VSKNRFVGHAFLRLPPNADRVVLCAPHDVGLPPHLPALRRGTGDGSLIDSWNCSLHAGFGGWHVHRHRPNHRERSMTGTRITQCQTLVQAMVQSACFDEEVVRQGVNAVIFGLAATLSFKLQDKPNIFFWTEEIYRSLGRSTSQSCARQAQPQEPRLLVQGEIL